MKKFFFALVTVIVGVHAMETKMPSSPPSPTVTTEERLDLSVNIEHVIFECDKVFVEIQQLIDPFDIKELNSCRNTLKLMFHHLKQDSFFDQFVMEELKRISEFLRSQCAKMNTLATTEPAQVHNEMKETLNKSIPWMQTIQERFLTLNNTI